MMDFLIVVSVFVTAALYFLSALFAVCYFSDTYRGISRLVFYIAILCPLWNCYFALKLINPNLKTFKPKEWLKRNFSFKK